jgi:hypothetical protein
MAFFNFCYCSGFDVNNNLTASEAICGITTKSVQSVFGVGSKGFHTKNTTHERDSFFNLQDVVSISASQDKIWSNSGTNAGS